MTIFDRILKPTLLLDENAARANIRAMAGKARAAGVAFRPHFKTHQSLEIGEWFRAEGVERITVSSLDMAEYFAAGGWGDITLAFSANPRQIAGLDLLAGRVRLGLLVESPETAAVLGAGLTHPVEIWLKIDTGTGRTGLPWDQPDQVQRLAECVQSYPHLSLRGLLTHAGNTYTAPNPASAARLFEASKERLHGLRTVLLNRPELAPRGLAGLQVSVGDTPGCSASSDFTHADEIRPGNFVFFDAQQYSLGSCSSKDIAVTLACPVVALHPERGEAVVYGGAIHLSKDTFEWQGERAYALVCLPEGERWGEPLPGAAVVRLSQEHGVLRLGPQDLARLRVGDLLCLIPAHSCLTAQALGRYLSLDGRWIEMMRA